MNIERPLMHQVNNYVSDTVNDMFEIYVQVQ